MIEQGVLDASGTFPIAAYGLHVGAGRRPYGTFTTRRGTLMASADQLHVVVRGAGGHGSRPHQARDPIAVACEMVTNIHTYVTRYHDVFDPVVVTVGAFHAGTADNVIPAEARFDATVRSFSAAARERVHGGLVRLVTGIAEAYGVTVEARYDTGYPVTVNDVREAEFVADTIGGLFGADRFDWMPDRSPAPRTSRSCWSGCRARSCSWAPARPTATRTRHRATTRRTRCSTTRCCRTGGAAGRAGAAPARLDGGQSRLRGRFPSGGRGFGVIRLPAHLPWGVADLTARPYEPSDAAALADLFNALERAPAATRATWRTRSAR